MDYNTKRALVEARKASAAQSAPSSGGDGYADCGPPYWSQEGWNRFRAQFGHDPFSRQELPPDLETAPAWVFERLGMRVPPFAR